MPSVQSGISGLAGFINRTIELRRAERAAAEEQKQAEKQLQIEQLMKMAQTPGIDPQAATGLMQKAAQLAGLKDEDLDAAMGREVQQQMGAPIQPPPSVDPQAAVQARESMTQPENVGEPVTPAPVQAPVQAQAGGVIPPPPTVDVDPGQMGMDEALAFQGEVSTPSRYDVVAQGTLQRQDGRQQAIQGSPDYLGKIPRFRVDPSIPRTLGLMSNPEYIAEQERIAELNTKSAQAEIELASEAAKDNLTFQRKREQARQALGVDKLPENVEREILDLTVETIDRSMAAGDPVSGEDVNLFLKAMGKDPVDLAAGKFYVVQQFENGEVGLLPTAAPKPESYTLTPGSTRFENGKAVASVPAASASAEGESLSEDEIKSRLEIIKQTGIDKNTKLVNPAVYRYAAQHGIPMPTSKIIGALQDIEKGVSMAQEVANRLAKVKGYENYSQMATDVQQNPKKHKGWAGTRAKTEGMWQQFEGKVGWEPEIAAIENTKGSLAVLLARAFGEVGNLAQQEQRMAMLAAPAVEKTPAEIVNLMDMLNGMIAEGKRAARERSMVSPGEWGVTMIEGDKTPVEDSGEAPALSPAAQKLLEKYGGR